jgi:hypothetical protein
MSASADLQKAIVDLLSRGGALRVAVPVLSHRDKEYAKKIEEAAAKQSGLCVMVLPPLPTKAMQGVPFVFFESAEVRVRIVEQPARNALGADAYDLVDDIASALHWRPREGEQDNPLTPILAHPLQLAARPTGIAEDPVTRFIDVIFEATFGFAPEQPTTP